ncbi:helix-turn-helix domain-containing protein [Streptomyces sp. NBC_01477]
MVGGGGGEAGQEQVDRIFGALRTAAAAPAALPKGHCAPTADLIRRVLREAPHPLSAHAVAERAGPSRSTAQRYLKHLEQAGRLRLTVKYGDTGRPEHRYAWARAG